MVINEALCVLSSPFHLSIRGRCHSIPLCSEAGKFDAFYSVVDRNIRDIVIWLWNALLVGYCLIFLHFYGLQRLFVLLYIIASNNFYHVSVVLSRVLPSKIENHE